MIIYGIYFILILVSLLKFCSVYVAYDYLRLLTRGKICIWVLTMADAYVIVETHIASC